MQIREDEQASMDRKMAEESDLKKYGEDLNTTLIFVSLLCRLPVAVLIRLQSGLFSAVTSAFIVETGAKLQPNMAEETAALLRVLIHQTDKTAFGNDIPTLRQGTGPPRTIVQIRAMLYGSLAISFFAACLATLGKQFLNQSTLIHMRGSATGRNQNQQRKPVIWWFTYLIELLPLTLQGSLFLLGCSLSLYLQGISTTIAMVVFCVTSLGGTFSVFATASYYMRGKIALNLVDVVGWLRPPWVNVKRAERFDKREGRLLSDLSHGEKS